MPISRSWVVIMRKCEIVALLLAKIWRMRRHHCSIYEQNCIRPSYLRIRPILRRPTRKVFEISEANAASPSLRCWNWALAKDAGRDATCDSVFFHMSTVKFGPRPKLLGLPLPVCPIINTQRWSTNARVSYCRSCDILQKQSWGENRPKGYFDVAATLLRFGGKQARREAPIDIIWAMVIVQRQDGRLSGLFCAVDCVLKLCTAIRHFDEQGADSAIGGPGGRLPLRVLLCALWSAGP